MPPSSVPGVEIAGPASPEYYAAVDRFFGPARSANLSERLPYGIVVTNRTLQTIVAAAVRWQLNSGTGTYSLLHEAFDNPNRQITPGKTVVALPQTLLFDGSKLPPQLQLTPPAGFVIKPWGSLPAFEHAQTVQVTLDGVVFASGQFVGTDVGKEFEVYVADTTVPAQVAAKVLAMKAEGEPVGTVVAWLQATENQPSNPKVQGWWNVSAAKRTARQLLRSYQRGGEIRLYEAAQGYLQMPVIRLYR